MGTPHLPRKKMPWDQNRSTNKYYGSDSPSALGTSGGDGAALDGPTPPIPTPTAAADERSTDKYYRSGGAKERGQKIKGKGAARAMPARTDLTGSGALLLDTAEDVAAVVAAAVDRVKAGNIPTTVVISPAGDSPLLRRARTALELAVTREQVTEEQARDIQFRYADPVVPVVPVPATTRPVTPPVTADPLDILSGKVPLPGDEDEVDVAPQDVRPVEVAADGTDRPVLAAASDDDLSVALPPVDDTAEVPALDVPLPEGSPPPVEPPPFPARPGRRTGRGSR